MSSIIQIDNGSPLWFKRCSNGVSKKKKKNQKKGDRKFQTMHVDNTKVWRNKSSPLNINLLQPKLLFNKHVLWNQLFNHVYEKVQLVVKGLMYST